MQENKMKFGFKIWMFFILTIVVSLAYYSCDVGASDVSYRNNNIEKHENIPTSKFGYNLDEYTLEKHIIKPNQFLSEMLVYQGISISQIHDLAKKSQEVFNVRKFRSGKSLTFIKKDSCGPAIGFVYEPNDMSYVHYDLEDSIQVTIKEHEVTRKWEQKQGVINISLWDAMNADNISLDVIDLMEDALGSSVDFYHVQKGDRFKLIYEQLFVEDKRVGVGRLKGAIFSNEIGDHYAIYYEGKKYKGFFNQDGIPNKRSFLKSPVRASRISSRFNRHRRHPVLKRIRPHLGTDYAAPRGTPIRAVASGVVVKASRTRNNGNYVKIKHDKVYSTQYLHMNGFAKGVRSGASVAQGDIIGYVGSTGLATGPHVCFRFWKNGRQVNHLRENFPMPDPIGDDELQDYFIVRDSVFAELDLIGNKLEADNPIVL